jgi:hypothetical protein
MVSKQNELQQPGQLDHLPTLNGQSETTHDMGHRGNTTGSTLKFQMLLSHYDQLFNTRQRPTQATSPTEADEVFA